MNTPNSCPACGKALAPNAPYGLCPECLLKAGVPTATSAGSTSGPPPRAQFVPPTPAQLAPHFPQLEVLALIGQGGMGAVYKARQPTLDRFVALKILAPQLGAQPGFAERFIREARALAKLSHPNIVAVHDFGQAGGFHYLVMEFVDGTNLRQVLATEKLPPREALAIVPAICVALQFAHDRGIVHRDIKPENILIDKTGMVKIADFGLAKLVGANADDFALTGAGDVMGTPHYMAPEQVERPRDVDHRADIYSLGVVFYQMLTGELPLGRFAPPSRKVEVDVRLDEIVLRALEKEPQLRYQQASVLKSDVENVARASPTTSFQNAADAIRRKFAHLLGVSISPEKSTSAPSTSAINAFADGDKLVVPVDDPRLPLRCVKTNQPVANRDVELQRFEWFPPIVVLSMFLTPVAFILLYYIFRQHVHVPVPARHEARRKIRQLRLQAGLGIAVGAIAFGVGLSAMTSGMAKDGVLVCAVGLVIFGAALAVLLIQGSLLRIVRLEKGHVWLSGASPDFLATLPAYRGAR